MSILNKTIGEMWGMKTPDILPNVGEWQFNTNLGIEVEMENFQMADNPHLWRITSDSSLRNGAEYISDIISGRSVYRAVHELSEHFKEHQPEADFNGRTSMHVHIDVTKMTVQELRNFAYLAIGAEPLLMRLVDASRHNNNFCLETRCASAITGNLRSMFQQTREGDFYNHARNIAPSRFKYAGINFANISRIGTVEFRMHHGTANKSEILNWVQALCTLRDIAVSYRSAEEIQEDKLSNNILEALRPRLEFKGITVDDSEVMELLDTSFEVANDILEEPPKEPRNLLSRYYVQPEEVLSETVTRGVEAFNTDIEQLYRRMETIRQQLETR